ncbi:hypothetical protein CLAIMM_13214 [Cladophialophora immunda]|nr:hypothetical protein CLAIMM_13214 [Cladophialophora immunda]
MAVPSPSSPLKSTCHCGAIEVIVPYQPKEINECQCTLCRRYAAAWIYYKPEEVTINKHKAGDVKKYVWGDRDISFNFCDNCGCMCFWYPRRGSMDEIGVNSRNMDPEDLRYVTRKISFDVVGAPLRDQATAHPQDRARY